MNNFILSLPEKLSTNIIKIKDFKSKKNSFLIFFIKNLKLSTK